MSTTNIMPRRTRNNGLSKHIGAENQMLDLRTQMDRLFDEFYSSRLGLGSLFGEDDSLGKFSPRLDIDETDRAITVSAELPGLKPEDVEIAIEDNLLTISGEKQAENETKEKHHYRMERSYGSFSRMIPLPTEVQEDKIEANLKDGLLKITLPKSKEAQQKTKRIPITSG